MVRKMIVALVLGMGLLGIQTPAHANGLYFQNYTSEPIWVAIALPNKAGNGTTVTSLRRSEPVTLPAGVADGGAHLADRHESSGSPPGRGVGTALAWSGLSAPD